MAFREISPSVLRTVWKGKLQYGKDSVYSALNKTIILYFYKYWIRTSYRTLFVFYEPFMLPCCIVIDFFLNNQPDALIIQILFCYKIGIISASGWLFKKKCANQFVKVV